MSHIDITRRTYSIYEKVFKENGFKLTRTNEGVKVSPLDRQPQHTRIYNERAVKALFIRKQDEEVVRRILDGEPTKQLPVRGFL